MNKQPFSGLKVWDMSWVGVGPLTARYLADHGATVVRLDSSKRPDILRTAPPFQKGQPGLDSSMFYGDYNCSKLGLGLDMAQPQGQEIARRLALWADVLIESFTPGNLAKWGLDYETLRHEHPSLVMLSTCMQGQTGPRAHYPGFGNLMAAHSGFYAVTGWPDGTPVPVYGAYTDFIAQRFTTCALVAALDHRRRTGQGQYIDVSQFEAASQFLGTELLDYAVNERVADRAGNAAPSAAPHGVYPCRGEDRWVAIAVEGDAAWQALKQKMGAPAWAEDDRFQTLSGRLTHQALLDQHLGDWTRDQDGRALMYLLQPEVAAAPVQSQSDLYEDPQVLYRGYFVELEHSVMGRVPYNGSQAVLSQTPALLSRASPCVGEDSLYVLEQLLGMDPAEVDQLVAAGVVEVSASGRKGGRTAHTAAG